MTIHRAAVTLPAPSAIRELSVSNGSPSPSATAPDSSRAGWHAVNGGPTAVAASDAAPVEVAERYLAPAIKAVAAARARTARIREAAWATAAGPARPYPPEWPVEPGVESPTVQAPSVQSPTPAPATGAPQPAPGPDLRVAPMAPALTVRRPAVAGSGGLPAVVPPSRGLSVAEAARASKISFRPLRRLPAEPAPVPVKPTALPASAPRLPGRRPAVAAPPATSKAAAPAQKAVAAPAVAPARAVMRPGGASPSPAAPARPTVPERAQPPRRFTKTVAELQRHQAETRPSEPWGNVVPRPAVPQANPAAAESRWSRLWSRR